MSQRAAAILLALGALAALPAAKPVPADDARVSGRDDSRERYRGQGISLCVAELRAVPDLGPDDLESICGCAVDRYLNGLRNVPNPQIEVRGALGAHMVGCTAQVRPDRTSDVARRRAAIQQSPAPAPEGPASADEAPAADAVVGGKPMDAEGAPADSAGGSAGGGFWDWLTNWSWPAWLTGAPMLWWIAGGILLFGLLIMKIRRRDPRQDLSAPPSYMRRGAPPQPPRRPDLPR